MKIRLAAVLMSLAAAGCSQNMTDQPKYSEYKPAPLFRNGRVLQTPVAGTVARGDLDRAKAASERPPLTAALLAHGRENFNVFCSPCHARSGYGNGMVVQRGMPRPPSLHIERLRTAPDEHIFDVITKGYGVMYSYAARVAPQDRWAIVAYIRALQLSQSATIEDVPEGERTRLLAGRQQ
jgi:mono/diheme cytochrome c family protein